MIRLGVVGCGNISRSHAAAWNRLSDRMKVTAGVDIDLERAESFASNFDSCQAVTNNYRQIYDDVDAVLLSLPHHLHHPIGMDFIKQNKHILMEKPLANTEEQCLDLIEASEKTDKVFMVAYCMCYHPLMEKLKELIDNKTYGDVFQVSIWTEQLTLYEDSSWAHSAETLGGGQLFSHGCHYIDLLLWFLGEPVEGTHTGTNLGTPWMEKEGTSNISIKFAGGAIGYHFGTWGARGSRLRYSFHVHCTEGMLEAVVHTGKLFLHTWRSEDTEEGKMGEKVLLETSVSKHVEREMEHFLNCVENRQKPLTDARSSLQGLRVIWKLYEAEADKKVADLRGLGLPG